jgi:hypothetical protein
VASSRLFKDSSLVSPTSKINLDEFSSIGTNKLDDGRKQIDLSIDAGINLLDTADMYSNGDSKAMSRDCRPCDILLKKNPPVGGFFPQREPVPIVSALI